MNDSRFASLVRGSSLARHLDRWASALVFAVVLGWAEPSARGFPPTLPHEFYGMIRDEHGHPLTAGASIVLETTAGTKVYGIVSGLMEPGVNYRLSVPMDAGLGREAYRPTALNPQVPFRIRIKIGNEVLLPIEMSREFASLGLPGQRTLLNLTLGEDLNGDGLPDAWQRRIAADIDSVAPNGDADRDGLSNQEEYLAGTYAYDTRSGFALTIERSPEGRPRLAFIAVTGRTYTVLGSADLVEWVPVSFRIVGAPPETHQTSYVATDVRSVRVEVLGSGAEVPYQAYKLMLE